VAAMKDVLRRAEELEAEENKAMASVYVYLPFTRFLVS